MENLKKVKVFLVAITFALFFIAPSVFAATLGFSPTNVSRTVGSTFSLAVYTSSVDTAINAVSGVISFPKDKLEAVSISKTSSVVNLWVQEPSFSNAQGQATFEGIILNPGYTGSQGQIVTITFRAKSVGQANINFSSGYVLANDGAGTNVLTSLGTASVSIQAIPVVESAEPDEPAVNIIESDNGALPEIPVVTDYQEEIYSGDILKVYGVANPGVDVRISVAKDGESIQEKTVRSTGTGNFIVVLDSFKPGVFSFTLHSVDEAGNKSEDTPPFTFIVKQKSLDKAIEFILSYLSLTMLLLLALLGSVVGALFIWRRLHATIRRMKLGTKEAEKVLEKSFDLLREDVALHISELKRVRSERKLTAEEINFLKRFGEELEEAESEIAKKIESISKS